MNAACPRRVSLIIAGGLPAIPSPTIDVSSGDSPGCPAIQLCAYRPLYRLRHSVEGSPIHADRIEFTAAACLGNLCYGPVVLVALLSTPCCHDAVTLRYLTALHRKETDSHRSVFPPSQAHDRDRSPVAAPRIGGQAQRFRRVSCWRSAASRDGSRSAGSWKAASAAREPDGRELRSSRHSGGEPPRDTAATPFAVM